MPLLWRNDITKSQNDGPQDFRPPGFSEFAFPALGSYKQEEVQTSS